MRRKIVSFLLTIAMITSLFGGLSTTAYATTGLWTDGITANASATYSGGDGTQGTPYLLASAEDLAQLTVNVAAGTTYIDKFFRMTQDVDLSEKYWVPIGYNGASFGVRVFQGTFDGNGHVVKNVVMDQNAVTGILEGDSFGFFNRLYGAAVRNFGIENGKVLLSTSKTHIGMLTGYSSSSTIETCFATGSVSANEGGTNVGGLIGTSRYSESAVTDCFFIGSVSGSSITDAGGLVGLLADGPHIPQNCYAAATMTIAGTRVYPLASAAANGYYDSTLGPAAAGGGTGKTTAEMKTADTAAQLNNSGGTTWGYDVGKNGGYPYLTVMEDPNTLHILTAPSAQTQNGVTAAVTFSPAVGNVTAVVTLTGTATAAGTHTIDLTSTKAGLASEPQTVTVTAGQNLTAAPERKSFAFTMPAENVDDFILTHTFDAADATAPVLTGTSVWRSAGDTATVRFTSDEAGTCYYQITDSETPPADVVTGGADGGAVTADTAKALPLTGLTDGAIYVHLVVKDGADNISDALTVSIPYDYYYYENFESYPLDTYIASNAMSPLAQRSSGTGSANQKVAANVSNPSQKMLSLASNLYAAGDHQILLDASTLAAAGTYIFEGDVYPLLDTGFQLRFSFTDGSYEGNHEAGVFFNGGKITTATQSVSVASSTVLKNSYTANEWHHLKIVADPSEGKYAVYFDSELLSDSLTLPAGINRLAISAGNLADNTTAYYDNLKFYLFPSVPVTRYAVVFNENSSGTPVESTFYIAAGSADFYTATSDGSVQTLTVPTRAGYVFGGWYKEAACTSQIIDNALALCAGTNYTDASGLWTATGAVILYAKWLEATPAGLGFDYENEMITGLTASAGYIIGGTAVTADADGKAALQAGWFNTALSVVKKGISSDYSFDSQADILNVPARPAAPTTLASVDETSSGAGDGQITGADDTMEYKLSTASDWTCVGSGVTTITGLDDGTYYVRVRAVTSGSTAFASSYTSVTVGTVSHCGVLQFESSSHGTYEGYNNWMIGVTRTGGSDGAVSVSYSMADGTAVAGTNYVAYSGTLTWADGDSDRKVIMFTSYDDSVYSGYLTLTCVLSNPTGGAVLGTQNPLPIQISDNDAPPVPTGLTAAVGSGTVTLSWSSVKDAYYKVYCTQTSGSFSEADLVTSVYDGTSCTVSGLTNGNTYYFTVKAGHNIYYSEFSAAASAVPIGGSPGGGTTGGDETRYIEVISSDGGTTVTGTVTDVENGVKISVSSKKFDLIAAAGQSAALKTDTVTVSFDAAAIDYIDSSAGSKDVVLEIVRADSADLPDESRHLVGHRPVYEFSLAAGGEPITGFGGGTATVSIPYTLGSDEDSNAVVVYYIDGSGSLIQVPGRYNAETGTVVFTADHFSVYAVGYNYVNFSDVADTAWYYNAVTFVAARGITIGTGSGNYSPDATLTRGQFLVMLMRAYGIEADANPADNFTDAGDTYYTNYLAVAKRLGISNGTGDNRFEPDSELTRQDMFTLLYRALDVLGEITEITGNKTTGDFKDAEQISDYAKTAMNNFVGAGIISGSDGKLNPMGTTTRAEMAQVLYHLMRRS